MNSPYIVARSLAPPTAIGFVRPQSFVESRKLQTRLSDEDLADHGLEIVRSGDRFVDSEALKSLGRAGPGAPADWLIRRPGNDTAMAVAPGWFPALEARIEGLRGIAEEEDMIFAETSARAALDFARRYGRERRPSAFLIGNGNIRLLWLSERQEQIGLQFREDKDVQIVLFEYSCDRLEAITTYRRIDEVIPFLERNRLSRLL